MTGVHSAGKVLSTIALLLMLLGHIAVLHTLCSKKSDAKIQITVTTVYLVRIKYPLSGFNYHLSDVNFVNFNKIHRTVFE